MDSSTATTSVEIVTERLKHGDLDDLCDATVQAIEVGGGFGWVDPPGREVLERYWRGVLVVPERTLFVGRLDGTVAGSVQLVRPYKNNEAQAFTATMTMAFVAPWARGHGLARKLALAVEEKARAEGFRQINIDVRETLEAAISLYKSMGYVHWGTNPHYALVHGRMVAGHYFYKVLGELPDRDGSPMGPPA